jgi:hypothetical protein
LVKSPDFGQELQKSLTDLTQAASNDPDQTKQTSRVVEVLLLELEASARAAEITLFPQDRDGERSWVRRMLGRGSIATGSVKDILEDFLKKYPLLKGASPYLASCSTFSKRLDCPWETLARMRRQRASSESNNRE